MLSGCETSGISVAPQLPALPAYVREPCRVPPTPDWIDLRVLSARDAQVIKACDAKRAGAVAFYDDMAKGLAGK